MNEAKKGPAFFNTKIASEDDRRIIDRYLPEGSGPMIAIFGHTHATRHLRLDGGREYLNTGTWMDLMKLEGPARRRGRCRARAGRPLPHGRQARRLSW
jgi:hypothetical protein